MMDADLNIIYKNTQFSKYKAVVIIGSIAISLTAIIGITMLYYSGASMMGIVILIFIFLIFLPLGILRLLIDFKKLVPQYVEYKNDILILKFLGCLKYLKPQNIESLDAFIQGKNKVLIKISMETSKDTIKMIVDRKIYNLLEKVVMNHQHLNRRR